MRDEIAGGGDSGPLGKRSSWFGLLSWLAVACIFSATFAYGCYRLRFGLDAADEGLYLAAPMRYALGDLPFRDEFFTPHRMFDVVLAPLFSLVPDISILELRAFWMTVQFGSMLSVFVLFRRFAPDVMVALACAATIWFGNLIWTPGYHLMGTYLFVLASATWLRACLAGRRRVQLSLGAASGGAFYLAAMSYLPISAAGAIPAGVLVWEVARGRWPNGRALATLGHLAGAGFLALGTLLGFAALGLLSDWHEAHRIFLSYANYAASPSEKLATFVYQARIYLPILLATPLIVLAMDQGVRRLPVFSRFGSGVGGIAMLCLAAAAGLLVGALLYRLKLPMRGWIDQAWMMVSLRLVAVVLGLHLGALLLIASRWRRSRDAGDSWGLVYTCVLSGSVILGFLHAFFSGHAFKTMWALLPLTVSGVVAVHRSLRASAAEPAQRALATLFAVVLCVVIGYFSHSVRHNFVYRGPPTDKLTAEFSYPQLAGIRSDPVTVAVLEKMLEYLSSRVEPGDFLLAYDQIPLFYYLTQTRPAVDHVWTSFTAPARVRARSLEKMIENGRVPGYVVFSQRSPRPWGTPDRATAPIHAFVRENYRREAVFKTPGWWDPGSGPQLEVWKRKSEAIRSGPATATSGE